jgi:hypothetical protein
MALPGSYQVRVTAEGKSQTAPFELKLDPRVHVPPQDLEKQFALSMQIRGELTRLYDAVNQIRDVQAQIRGLHDRLPAKESSKRIQAAGDELDRKLSHALDGIIDLKISANEDSLAFPIGLDGKFAVLAAHVSEETDSAPTEASYRVFEKLKRQLDEQLASWAGLRAGDLAAFQKLTAAENIQAIFVREGTTVEPAAGSVGKVSQR